MSQKSVTKLQQSTNWCIFATGMHKYHTPTGVAQMSHPLAHTHAYTRTYTHAHTWAHTPGRTHASASYNYKNKKISDPIKKLGV